MKGEGSGRPGEWTSWGAEGRVDKGREERTWGVGREERGVRIQVVRSGVKMAACSHHLIFSVSEAAGGGVDQGILIPKREKRGDVGG